jgi:ATP/maltotriose-dependent transcriptional regulator MalT
MLAEVVRWLPAHAHLVLSGRSMPALPLARLRAAERVLEISQQSLAFTGVEVAAVAESAGRDILGLDGLGVVPDQRTSILLRQAGIAELASR